jgi:putative FmdB family regulatory protein
MGLREAGHDARPRRRISAPSSQSTKGTAPVPIYEYHCKKCTKDFELVRPVDARNNRAKCAHCGSTATTLKLSAFAFVGSSTPDLLSDDAGLDEFGMGGHGHDHDDDGFDMGGFDDDDFGF